MPARFTGELDKGHRTQASMNTRTQVAMSLSKGSDQSNLRGAEAGTIETIGHNAETSAKALAINAHQIPPSAFSTCPAVQPAFDKPSAR